MVYEDTCWETAIRASKILQEKSGRSLPLSVLLQIQNTQQGGRRRKHPLRSHGPCWAFVFSLSRSVSSHSCNSSLCVSSQGTAWNGRIKKCMSTGHQRARRALFVSSANALVGDVPSVTHPAEYCSTRTGDQTLVRHLETKTTSTNGTCCLSWGNCRTG